MAKISGNCVCGAGTFNFITYEDGLFSCDNPKCLAKYEYKYLPKNQNYGFKLILDKAGKPIE